MYCDEYVKNARRRTLAISRTINGLEKEGLVSRTSPRQPVLTEKGIEEAALTRFFMGVYALK